MRLWRLSGARFANRFDGGYGLLFDGRWNTVGHAVTYCATGPSLCVLEKLVHVEDPDLLPDLVMVAYEAPDDLAVETVDLAGLPPDWRHRQARSQQIGGEWHRRRAAPLLKVPSAVVPIIGSPDVNVLVNHAHPDAARISIGRQEAFVLDPRLL